MTPQLIVDNTALGVLRKSAEQKPEQAIVIFTDGDGNLQARWSTMTPKDAVALTRAGLKLLIQGTE